MNKEKKNNNFDMIIGQTVKLLNGQMRNS